MWADPYPFTAPRIIYKSKRNYSFLLDTIIRMDDLEHINSYTEAIAASDRYYKNKDFDNAYRTLTKAALFVNNPTDHFNYLWNLKEIKEKSARIVFEEDNPHYDLYLIFFFEAFALEIARDLTGFPSCAPFYYRKKIQWSPDYGDDDDFPHNIALKKLNIYQYKKAIVSHLIDFVYNELPLIYGIPQKYGEEEANRIYNTHGHEWQEMVRFSYEELHKRSIDIVPYKINEFVRNLLQKYYDKGIA